MVPVVRAHQILHDPPSDPPEGLIISGQCAGSSRRQRWIRDVCAPCRGRGLWKSATNAITPGRVAPLCTPLYATSEQRTEVGECVFQLA